MIISAKSKRDRHEILIEKAHEKRLHNNKIIESVAVVNEQQPIQEI